MKNLYKCEECVYMNMKEGIDDMCGHDPGYIYRKRQSVACSKIRLATSETEEKTT